MYSRDESPPPFTTGDRGGFDFNQGDEPHPVVSEFPLPPLQRGGDDAIEMDPNIGDDAIGVSENVVEVSTCHVVIATIVRKVPAFDSARIAFEHGSCESN